MPATAARRAVALSPEVEYAIEASGGYGCRVPPRTAPRPRGRTRSAPRRLEQPAATDDRHGVGDHLHLGEDVTGHQDRLPPVGEAAHGGPDLVDAGWLETVGGLVEDQEVGILEQRRVAGTNSEPIALAAVGFCAGLLARHTAAAIGVLLAYLFLWFVRNGPLSQLAWAQRLTPWTPEGNLSAVVGNGSTYEVLVDKQAFEFAERHISLAHGIGYWVALVGVLAVVPGLVFRRRDVT